MSAELPAEINVAWLAEHVPANIVVLDKERRIRFVNRTVPGITPEELVGRPLLDLIEERYHATVSGALDRVRATQESDRYETNYVSPLGEVSEWESRAGPVLKDGLLDGFVLVSTNVTERKREVAESKLLFDLSPDLLCVASFDGYFKRVNPRFFDTLGYADEELMALPFVEFVHPEDRAETLAELEKLRQGGTVFDFENRYRHRDGSYRKLAWNGAAEPSLGLVFANARDVTDRRAHEERLRTSQRLEALGQFAAGVAHDFNNLLQAIASNAQLVRMSEQREMAPGTMRALRDIEQATDRAAALTRSLLSFGRDEAASLEALDVSEVARSLLSMMRRVLPASIEVSEQLEEALPPVRSNRGQLDQVLMNLLINARDAMPDGGALTVSTKTRAATEAEGRQRAAEGMYLELCVADTGHGMSTATLERVFEPFFTTKGAQSGFGLGLSTVASIVDKHGGWVEVESREGLGTKFKVLLPAESEELPVSEPAKPKTTVLVAEDAEPVRRVVVRVLERAGYQVLAAEDGQEALELAARHQGEIQVAILDVMMPRKTGPAAAAELRAQRPNIGILLVSGFSEPELLSRSGFDANDVLSKPFRTEQLLEMVRDRLAASRSQK